ncbi:L,D-transpeptidase [Streptomyces sp. NPDC002701]|uniref:L,D-transpeptidase n=1 Tax=Streptomyces sp. NPDC002701 TaxID=3364661 RepID=UPI0036ADF00F
MSDELTPGRRYEESGADTGTGTGAGPGSDRSELATALRGLAQDHETPVTVPGAEIRRRAVRRRRRRTASLAAAGTACAGALALVLAVVLSGGEESRSVPPAASYSAPAPPVTAEPSPVPVAATVDLGRREVTAGGRTLPISSGTVKSPTPTGLMTVVAKYETTMLPGEVADWSDYEIKATWVLRLRGADDRTAYLLALNWDETAPGNHDVTGGAIGLRSGDARWLYEALPPGAVVEVVGSAPTPTPVATRTGAGAQDTASPTTPTTPATQTAPASPTEGANNGAIPAR